MDLRGYTTVDEVGEDPQVRNVVDFRPTTAAEEIEYLNKILENMENYDSKENSKSEIPELEGAVSENDPHNNHIYNNNALDLITEVCSETLNVELGKTACEQNFIRDDNSGKLEQLSERCTIKEFIEKTKSDCNEVDIRECGLPCADDILTQAENQHLVIQDIKSGHVQNELSTEPNLIMADPAIPDVEDHFRQSPGCTHSNFSPKAELEDKLEAHSIEPVSSDAPNETGSSELSSSTKEATIMPVNCSAESSSVLESRHYSAKETFDFISGEDVSESSTLDSIELGDVSSLSNVVLGDIGSLLENSIDQPNVTDENTPAQYETQIDLSIVKSEPVCTDPGEDFDLKNFCSDPGEEFVLKENTIKEEPLEYSPPAPVMNQEEVLLPVKIFKSEGDSSDEQVVMPNIRYLVDEKKVYSREEVSAALIISQSSLSPIIDMEMFQNLGKTKLAVSSSRLEDMLKHPKRLALEDFSVVQLFRSNYGSSLHEWKAYFKFRGNYSVKHTAKKKARKQTESAPTEKKKGRRGRRKKCETEVSNIEGSIKGDEVKNEGMESGGDDPGKMYVESTKAFPLKEERKPEKRICEKDSLICEDSSKVKETGAPSTKKGRRGRKKKCLMEPPDTDSKCSALILENVQIQNESAKEKEARDSAPSQMTDESSENKVIKEEAVELKQGLSENEQITKFESDLKLDAGEDVSHERRGKESVDHIDDTETRTKAVSLKGVNATVKSEQAENRRESNEASQQLNLPWRACYVYLYDIAKDATYGMIVRRCLKENNGKCILEHCVEEPMKENSAECKIPKDLFSDDSSDESFTGFSPVKQSEESLDSTEEYLGADEGKDDPWKEMEHEAFSKEDKAEEKLQLDVVAMEEKDEPNQSELGENIGVGAKLRKEVDTEINLLKENKGGSNVKKEEDIQNEKDVRRARKRLKLESEDLDERRISSRDKRKSISEDYFSVGVLEDLEREENAVRSDSNKNDGAQDVPCAKKSKEEVLTTKDRNPASSSLPALSSFRIPKKKVTHVGESKPQEQNSVLLRRGESPATQKSVGYFSKKQFNAQSRKADFREKERHNTRNIKNETKPVIHVQQPVNEGWAKRGPPPPYGGGYHPQPGFPNMPIRNMSPASVTHLGPGNNKTLISTTANQQRMQFNPYDRAHMTAKGDHSKLPCSQFGAGSTDKPVRQVNVLLNVPPPPPLEKLYPNSSLLKQGSESIQATPYESSPVMSYDNSSDGESDVAETDKTSLSSAQQAQPPLTSVTGTPIIDVTKTYKASLCNTQLPPPSLTGSPDIEVTEMHKSCLSSVQPPLRNVTGTPNISITEETCKSNVSRVQSSHNNSTGIPNITTTTKVTDKVGEEISCVKEVQSKEGVSQNAESSKDKVEAKEGASKDHYQNLDKRQKIKLYEKRKRYYHESRKKYYAEKGDKKHFWLKEYEKRKKEYYHLKIYLYKEKKKEQMANKIHKETHDSHNNSEHKTSASAEPDLPEQREKSCNTAVEAEEIPYSPTGSPIDFDDIEVPRSLPEEAPKKLPTDKKEQEVVDYPNDKLKEMLMLVMNTLNKQSSDAKSDSESHSKDTEARSKENESVEGKDEYHTLETTSPFSSPLKTSESFLSLNTSESFLSPTSSIPLPLKDILLPPASPPLLDKAPVSVPLPSLPALPLTSPVSSKTLPKDSLTALSSSTSTPPLPVPPPHPVPAPNSASSLTFSFSLNKKSVYDRSPLNSGKNGSHPNSESKVELPVPAPPLKSFEKKPHPEIAIEHSLQTKDIALPPLPSSPAPPLPGQELIGKMSKFVEDSSLPSVTPGNNALPPLPPPPPRPPFEEFVEKTSVSRNADIGGLEEINAIDDTTAIPMDIDSDEDKNYESSHNNYEDENETSHDNYDGKNDETSLDNYEDKNNEISGCQDKNAESKHADTPDSHDNNDSSKDSEVPECHEESDRDFLALFGVYEDKSPALEEEADSHGNGQMTKLLRKLMSVTSSKKPGDERQGDECGQNAKLKENDTPLVLERPRSAVNPVSYDEKEMDDSNSSKELDTLPVTNVNVSQKVSVVPDKDTLAKATKEEEAEVTPLSSCSRVNRKRQSSDEVIGGSFKGEIEIITPKEPPKNLICVDEILLSVEAADQPADLQIIYADLRKTPREKPNIIRDEVPKYYQKTALAQTLVDKCKDLPLVGLQYVLEVRKDHDMSLDACFYICAVCSKKMTAHTLVAHIKSVPHRLKFSESHCKNIYHKYGSYELKEWTATLVKAFTMDLAEIEKKMGRHKLAVAVERDMPSVLKSLKQKISEISSLGQQQEEKTKVTQIPTPSQPSEPATTTTFAKSTKDVPLPDTTKPKNAGTPAASKIDIPLPSKSPGPNNGNANNKKNDGFDDNDEEDEVLVLSQENKTANAKKFSSSGQGFSKRNYRPGPNARRRSSSRSSTPSLSPGKTRSRSRSKSRSLSPKRNPVHSPPNKLRKHSKSPPRKKPDRRSPQRHGLERPSSDRKRRHSRSPISPHHRRSRSRQRDVRKRYRSRSRSRSRHRSPPPYRKKDGWPRRSPPPKRETTEEKKHRAAQRRLEDFRDAEIRIKARYKNEQVVFEKTPESHPLYNREWKVFWERRCRELEKEGLDPFLYDFKSEWAVFWHHRMKELMEQNFKNKRDALLRKFRLDDPDEEERKLYGGNKPPGSWKQTEGVEKVSRIDRSPSPWEDDGTPAIARNPSPKPGEISNTNEGKDSFKNAENPATKFEDDFSVIGTLKLLNELEDQLGSFGPAITTLLGKAVDCSQKGEDTLELFKDPDNLVLVRYAREKLSSQISAGILGVAALVKTQMAVERSMWLQSQAEKLANEGKYLGLDITGIARATLGRDTVQIAQYIAQHLLQVGKSNASENDLQNILYAVLAAHTKLLVETSKKAQVDTPVIEGTTPVSAPEMPASSDPPKELPAEPSGTLDGTKQPLFPSTAPSNSAANDKNVNNGDRNLSERVIGGLGMLQSAYEEENGKDMENLSLDDLRSLLSNFSSLSTEEKQALTTYLKKLEATDSKKVMKLREEIQKSARNATKASNVKFASKPGKVAARPQGTPHIDSNSLVAQQQPSEGSQMSTPEGKVPLPSVQAAEDQDMRLHSRDSTSQPLIASSRESMDNSRKADVMHDSRGFAGPAAGMNLPTHNMPPAALGMPAHNMPPSSIEPASRNMPPAPRRMAEMAQDFGPGIGHKHDRMDQPMFDDGRNRPFPQRPFMDRQEPGSGMSDMKEDRNYDRFGYEPLPGQNNPMGPDGSGRFERPGDARFDRLGDGRFDRPGEPQFDGPEEPRLDRPGEPRFNGPGEPRFSGPGEQRFSRPGEQRFDGPGEPRFDGPGDPQFDRPGEPKFDGPGGPRFDGAGGPRFDRPREARFDGPGEPKFDRPGEQRFGGPGESRFSGPGEPRFDRPGESRFDGPGGPHFNRPGEPMFDGPGEPGFDRPGESRFGRPGEPLKPQWQGFGRGGGPQVDNRAFPPQDERHYQWLDEAPQGPNESRAFGPRGRAGHSFRGGPRRGLHPNTRQPYRESW